VTDSLQALDGQRFDAVIIGGGINGASAVQQLSAAGYRCLLAEKDDFASGASGRSPRMLHCGLRYFETPRPVRDFALAPWRFLQALDMARQSMAARAELARDSATRLKPFTMCFPVYRGGPVAGWQVRAGLRLLRALGPRDVPLDDRQLSGAGLAELPFLGDLRAPDRIASVACYREYMFDWPERFCLDAVLDAERNGAVVRNDCRADLGERTAAGDWRVALAATDGPATVEAPLVLVMAGTWIDGVVGTTTPLIRGTKGAHILVRMPGAYRGYGISSLHRGGHPFYLLPSHEDVFCFGPTETPFEGDATDVQATDEEIDFLIGEANHMLPGRRLTRRDVELTWAGVRPLTWDPGLPMGNRLRKLHDLGERGMPGVLAMTAGPVMTHRSAGRMVLDAVARRLPPSARRGVPRHRPFEFARGDNARSLSEVRPEVTAADVENAARREHARSLADILIRRVGLGGRSHLARADVEAAARIAAPVLGWAEDRIAQEVAAFLELQARTYRRPGQGGEPEM